MSMLLNCSIYGSWWTWERVCFHSDTTGKKTKIEQTLQLFYWLRLLYSSIFTIFICKTNEKSKRGDCEILSQPRLVSSSTVVWSEECIHIYILFIRHVMNNLIHNSIWFTILDSWFKYSTIFLGDILLLTNPFVKWKKYMFLIIFLISNNNNLQTFLTVGVKYNSLLTKNFLKNKKIYTQNNSLRSLLFSAFSRL